MSMDPPLPAGARLSANEHAGVNPQAIPALSIITPTRNAAHLIEACLQNVLRQDCDEIEHIVVDAHSQDGTVAILESFARTHRYVRYISEPDRGQSDALNKGLRMARAAVVGILNVDDFYERGVLQRVIRRFRALAAPSLLVGNCRVLGDDGAPLGVNRPFRLALEDLLLGPEFVEFPCNPSAYFYHRQLHSLIGAYDEADHYTMDLDFLLRAIPRATVIYEDEIWGNYRLRIGSKTQVEMAAGRNTRNADATIIKHLRRLTPLVRTRVSLKRVFLRLIRHNKLRLLNLYRKARRLVGVRQA